MANAADAAAGATGHVSAAGSATGALSSVYAVVLPAARRAVYGAADSRQCQRAAEGSQLLCACDLLHLHWLVAGLFLAQPRFLPVLSRHNPAARFSHAESPATSHDAAPGGYFNQGECRLDADSDRWRSGATRSDG